MAYVVDVVVYALTRALHQVPHVRELVTEQLSGHEHVCCQPGMVHGAIDGKTSFREVVLLESRCERVS
jgi:hypothetical protein